MEPRESVTDGRSRREFFRDGALVAGGALLGVGAPILGRDRAAAPGRPPEPAIPTRVLGRTKFPVTILGLGTAPMGQGPIDTPGCVRLVHEALERGINYIDTARIYGNSEEALGEALGGRRDRVFLATKAWSNSAEGVEKSFTRSLELLRVDAVDCLHLHSSGDKNVDEVLGPKGALEAMVRYKKQGKTRFIGLTGHNRPSRFVPLLETGEIDVLMVALNFADRHVYDFEQKVLPVARKHGTGVLAMKVYGGVRPKDAGKVWSGYGHISPARLDPVYFQNSLRYVLGLEGVASAIIGIQSREQLAHNVRLARSYVPLSDVEREALEAHGRRIGAEWGPRFGPNG